MPYKATLNNRTMSKVDLHKKFIHALSTKISKRAELVNKVADILSIEKESASRRLSGKVYFSVREMGLLAEVFHISIDHLIRDNDEYLWLPFSPESPMKFKTMDKFCNAVNMNINSIGEIVKEPAEAGSIFSSLPVEFFIHYPALMKFMFFKWGYYFVGTEEFYHFSRWNIPTQLNSLKEKICANCRFEKLLYIWDSSLIWSLTTEINNFHKMHIITTEEKDTLKTELTSLLKHLEGYLNGTIMPFMPLSPEVEFYVSTMNIGFTCCYYASKNKYMISHQTNFSYALLDNCYQSFTQIKEWIKSLRKVSILLSASGHIERRVFFEREYNTINQILGK